MINLKTNIEEKQKLCKLMNDTDMSMILLQLFELHFNNDINKIFRTSFGDKYKFNDDNEPYLPSDDCQKSIEYYLVWLKYALQLYVYILMHSVTENIKISTEFADQLNDIICKLDNVLKFVNSILPVQYMIKLSSLLITVCELVYLCIIVSLFEFFD